MSNKDKALRVAYRAFRFLSAGEKITQKQAKQFADMCALALPMRYRFTRAELADMVLQAAVDQTLQELKVV